MIPFSTLSSYYIFHNMKFNHLPKNFHFHTVTHTDKQQESQVKNCLRTEDCKDTKEIILLKEVMWNQKEGEVTFNSCELYGRSVSFSRMSVSASCRVQQDL